MAPRKKELQSLYLDPVQAKLLDDLAAETRIPKAVLLREAVVDLLAKHAKAESPWYADIVMALKAGLPLANRMSKLTQEETWLAKCVEYRHRANEILAVLGKK